MPSIGDKPSKLEEMKVLLVEIVKCHAEFRSNRTVNCSKRDPLPKESPMIGDIILMGTNPSVNTYQSLKRKKPATYSHVAISLGGGIYIDAVPFKKGIGIRKIRDIKSNKKIKVLRHKTTIFDDEKIKLMISYIGNDYSLYGLVGRQKFFHDIYQEPLFCSEFVEKIYGKDDIVDNSSTEILLPIDFENLELKEYWEDVSGYYSDEFDMPDEIVDIFENSVIAALSSLRSKKGFEYAKIEFQNFMEARFSTIIAGREDRLR